MKLRAAELLRSRAVTLDEIIAEAIYSAIDEHGGHMAATAETLGISRSTLYRYVRRFRKRILRPEPR